MKALANRWMGRFPSMPEALPRHSVPCRLQNLHIYEVTVRCRGEKLVFMSSIFAFTVPLMLPCKALGPPNNHATGHDGQIDIENYKSKILEVKQL